MKHREQVTQVDLKQKFEIFIVRNKIEIQSESIVDAKLFRTLQKGTCTDLFLDLSDFGLNERFLGTSRTETLSLFKSNNKKLLKCFSLLKKCITSFCVNKIFLISKTCKLPQFENTENDSFFAHAKTLLILLKAIQIKNWKERLEYVYDSSSAFFDEFYATFKPCDFANGECISFRTEHKYPNPSCCSKNCEFLGEKGCLTKNLCCKLYICPFLRAKGILFNSKWFLPTKIFFSISEKRIVQNNFYISHERLLEKLNKAHIWGPLIC